MMLPSTVSIQEAGVSVSHQVGSLELTIYGLRVAISSNDPDLLRWLGSVFPSTPSPCDSQSHAGASRVRYEVSVADDPSSGHEIHTVSRDGVAMIQTTSWSELQSCLERAITLDAAQHLGYHHLVHAGAVARNGRGVLLPEPEGLG